MKKLLIILLALLILGACDFAKPVVPVLTTSEVSVATNVEWLTYAPKDIKLIPDEQFLNDENYGYIPKYRRVYYDFDLVTNVTGIQTDLVKDKKALWEFYDMIVEERRANGGGYEIDEMYLITYIKHFKIPKEAFEKAIEEKKHFCVSSGFYNINPESEVWELPNPDIIYTFDNEIINAYYRRENPVTPDWSKTKTYESYEEYLRMNGG